MGKTSSKWVFGSEPRGGKKDNSHTLSPGPGAYKLNSQCFDSEKPKFFMGTRLSPLKGIMKPGPGAHDPNMSLTKYSSSSFSVGKKFGKKFGTLAPGPGNHDVNFKIDKRTSPRYGFGSSTRE